MDLRVILVVLVYVAAGGGLNACSAPRVSFPTPRGDAGRADDAGRGDAGMSETDADTPGGRNCQPVTSALGVDAGTCLRGTPDDSWLGYCPTGMICDLNGVCQGPHYTVNDDGTVTDNVTCLVWQQLVPSDPCPMDAQRALCSWDHAQDYCRSLSLGRYSSGWRLPSVAELYSLFDLNKTLSASFLVSIDSSVFPNTLRFLGYGSVSADYWSSTAQAAGGGDAVDFLGQPEGSYGGDWYSSDNMYLLVRCVH